MVRIDVGGLMPNIEVDTSKPGGIKEAKTNIRRRMKGIDVFMNLLSVMNSPGADVSQVVVHASISNGIQISPVWS